MFLLEAKVNMQITWIRKDSGSLVAHYREAEFDPWIECRLHPYASEQTYGALGGNLGRSVWVRLLNEGAEQVDYSPEFSLTEPPPDALKYGDRVQQMYREQ